MPFYLLTVDRAYEFGKWLQVLPRVRVNELAERARDLMMPAPGDILELRLPDGQKRHAVVATFGIEAWRRDGRVLTNSDPEDPVLTLNISGDLVPDELPAGTEIWLQEPKFKPQPSEQAR